MQSVTIVRQYGSSQLLLKIARELKKKSFDINLISLLDTVNEKNRDLFTNIVSLTDIKTTRPKKKTILFKIFSSLPSFLWSLRKIKGSTIIGFVEPNFFVCCVLRLMKRGNNKQFILTSDTAVFRYKNYKRYPFIERFSEKKNFQNCNGIIYKGPHDLIKNLPDSFQAKTKKNLQFLPYCNEEKFIDINDEYFSNKLSIKDRNIHVVYVGGIHHNQIGYEDNIKIYKKITEQKIHVHLYPVPMEKYKLIIGDKQYKNQIKKGFLHIHKPKYGKSYLQTLSSYDYGIILNNYQTEEISNFWGKYVFGNKVSDFIEAGIPILVGEELEFTATTISSYHFGIVIKNIKNLKKTLMNVDYYKLINNVEKNRKEFTMSHNINRLIEFISN